VRLHDDALLHDLEFSTRLTNVINKMGITTVRQARMLSDPHWRRHENMGRISLAELREVIPYDPVDYGADWVAVIAGTADYGRGHGQQQ
jgi:DNA-directed RNA polymerase alpha subunit